jgi:hypothetical protein
MINEENAKVKISLEDLEWYVEVSNGVKRKTPPEMIKVSKLHEWQARHQSSTQGLFSSIYMYPTDDPYIDGVLSDCYMDFDSEETPDKARKEAVAVVKKLITDYDIPEENITIAFSGMKGISITVDYQVFNADIVKDSTFPFKIPCRVKVRIDGERLIVEVGLENLEKRLAAKQ